MMVGTLSAVMNKYTVVFYKNARGQEPVREFIGVQDRSTRSKFLKLYKLLQIYGPQLMMPYARNLKGGLYELRIRGKNEVRVFYICLRGNQAVLLHAFRKRTEKTPPKELAVAKHRKNKLTSL